MPSFHCHNPKLQGAGEANIGIAHLLAMAMEKREGVPFEQVRSLHSRLFKHLYVLGPEKALAEGFEGSDCQEPVEGTTASILNSCSAFR